MRQRVFVRFNFLIFFKDQRVAWCPTAVVKCYVPGETRAEMHAEMYKQQSSRELSRYHHGARISRLHSRLRHRQRHNAQHRRRRLDAHGSCPPRPWSIPPRVPAEVECDAAQPTYAHRAADTKAAATATRRPILYGAALIISVLTWCAHHRSRPSCRPRSSCRPPPQPPRPAREDGMPRRVSTRHGRSRY